MPVHFRQDWGIAYIHFSKENMFILLGLPTEVTKALLHSLATQYYNLGKSSGLFNLLLRYDIVNFDYMFIW